MKEIGILHSVIAKNLNHKYYFQSLMDVAQYNGLLSQKTIQEIQNELLTILAEQIDKWNAGKSSSIRIEKAQDILDAILFVIGVALKSHSSPKQSIESMRNESMKSLYEKGLKRVRHKKMIARRLQKQILDNLFQTPNKFYRSTIMDAINGFFKLYRPQFSAHEIHITADYPTYLKRPELNGIEFIEAYLRYIDAENAFCILFDSKDIHHLLCGLTLDYHSIPMNIFEPVLLSALGLILTKQSPRKLDLSTADIEILYQLFKSRSVTEIQTFLEKALIILDEIIKLPKQSKKYVSICLPNLAISIEQAVIMGTLDKIFLVPVCPEKKPKISYSYGESMNDRQYRKLLNTLSQIEKGNEKIELILQKVNSLADLLDILSDVEFQPEDFELLVNRLPLLAFALLLSQYPNDDFLDRENEQLLYDALQRRRRHLSRKKNQQVREMLMALQNEVDGETWS